MGVTHPTPPARHPGLFCHLWVWLGCPQSSCSLSLSPSAMHPMRCPKWGMWGAAGFPPWHNQVPVRAVALPHAPTLPTAGEFPDALSPPSHECSPPLTLLRGSRGAQTPPGATCSRAPPAPGRAGVAGRLPQWCRARQTGFMASGREKLLGKRLREKASTVPLPSPRSAACPSPTAPHCPAGRGPPSPRGTQGLPGAGGHLLWDPPLPRRG